MLSMFVLLYIVLTIVDYKAAMQMRYEDQSRFPLVEPASKLVYFWNQQRWTLITLSITAAISIAVTHW